MFVFDLNEAVLAFFSFLFNFCLVGLSKRSVELLESCVLEHQHHRVEKKCENELHLAHRDYQITYS